MLARTLSGMILLASACAAAAADSPAPGGIPDLAGPRSLALSGGIGIAASNEGLFVNPASVGARKRYSVEALMLVDRRGADTAGQFYGASVVDSLTSPATGGISYVRAQRGDYVGSLWHAVLSGPVAQDLHLGVAGKYLAVSGPKNAHAATVDAGLFWQVADLLSIGAAGYNLVPIANDAVAPMGAGAGIGIGSDRSLQVTADWRADFDRAGKTTNRYGAGVEVLLGNLVPLRAGWSKDETLGTKWWSAGVGLVTQAGVAIDVGYRQSLDDASARTVAATLKLFLFQ
ncbi:MAG TPA: hypothetical protein VIW03_17040 [Anaeromyxobacter sp.]